MVATAAGLVVPAHVLAESKYEFRQRIAGLKPAGSTRPIATAEERTGVMSNGQILASDGGVDWYGEVPASDLIDGIELAALIGLTAGTPQFSDTGWLHVGLDGKELFIAKRPLRSSISWNQIYAASAVYGGNYIEKSGQQYTFRLPKGANSNPATSTYRHDPASTHGSEWNRIFYRLTDNNYLNSGNKKTSEEPFVQLAQYTEEDLVLDSGLGYGGSSSWCQERYIDTRIKRGGMGVSNLDRSSSTSSDFNNGWRPVLEKI
jgi:hypothetical protein